MKKYFKILLIFLLSILFILSLVKIITYHIEASHSASLYDSLDDLTEGSIDETSSEESNILAKYAKIYEQNPDTVGWIKIDNTKINYPVMQSITESDFYLNHNFLRERSVYGCPYIKPECDIYGNCDNIIIYGHNMKNGTMFADIEKFRNKEFYEKNKTICFDTLYEIQKYEIISVFEVDFSSSEAFNYHNFITANNEIEFNEFINKCHSLSFYETDLSANYGDKLLTLSTCSSDNDNKRIVIVAKKIY